MRYAYELCKEHNKRYCTDSKCKAEERDDSSSSSLDTSTDVAMSLLIGPLSTIFTNPDC